MSKTTRKLIQEVDTLKGKIQQLEAQIQVRMEKHLSRAVIQTLSTAFPSEMLQTSTFQKIMPFIVNTLRNGNDVSIDNLAINSSELDFDQVTHILRLLEQATYVQESIWAWDGRGGYKEVNKEKFKRMCQNVALGSEYPYNMLNGDDLEGDDWLSDNYQTIWTPTDTYVQAYSVAYQNFLDCTSFGDDE